MSGDDVIPTSTVIPGLPGSLPLATQAEYDPCLPIGDCRFLSGRKYGPFFRADKEEIQWYFDAKPTDKNWAGLAEPRTKQEAMLWYDPPSCNPLTHVHEFYIRVSEYETWEAVGFVGKVRKGTGFQINLNYIAVRHIVLHHVKELR